MSFIRSTLALLLLLASAGVALLGVGSQWLDALARTPEPAREIVGGVTRDDAVVRAIATQMENSAKSALSDYIDFIPGLREQLEVLIRQGIDLALADADLNKAWFESVDLTRASTVEALDAMRSGPGTTPTVNFPLRPFLELGEAKLYEVADLRLHEYIKELHFPKDVTLPLGTVPQPAATWASEGLGVAEKWPWIYGGAAALALVGLVVGSRRGRWVALLLAAGAAAAALVVAKGLVGSYGVPSGTGIVAAIQDRLINGATTSMLARMDVALIATIGVAVVAVIGLTVSASLSRRNRSAAAR